MHDDHVAPLHVDDPGAARSAVGEALEFLERVRWLEHRIEVPDQQYVRAAPLVLGNEVAGTLERGAIDPPRGEAERVELLAHHVTHGAHAGEIHRPAVDVDDALEEGERLAVARVDGAGDGLLGGGERLRAGVRRGGEGEESADAKGKARGGTNAGHRHHVR